jgi:hypothetical protein
VPQFLQSFNLAACTGRISGLHFKRIFHKKRTTNRLSFCI